jgi:uncharacterized protein YbjT (DUF2867 family)
MNTVIFGANGPTGRLLVEQAVAAGHTVTAAMRNPQPIDGATVVRADVLDAASVGAAVKGADAVLSSLGVPFGRNPIDTYSRGTANIIAAMKEHGVRRLVLTSSSAADPSVRFKNSGGGALLEALKPLVIYGFGRTTYIDMRRMEKLVTESGLDWTIVRPSGLFNTDVASDYSVEQDHVRGAFTSRLDLARFMVSALDSDEWVGRNAAIATKEGAPKVLEFFRSEALK